MPVITEGPTLPQLDKSIGEWVKANTIDLAMRSLKAEVARGFDNEPVVITDGVPRRDPADVKPFGKIEFVARTDVADAVRWALTELQKRSPVLTGRYASSHVVMINGVEVTGNIWQKLRAAKPGVDRVQIVNTQPYARKIEGATASKKTGRQRRRGSSKQARAGVYRPVLRALVQRYGRSMFFDYRLVKLDLGVKVWGLSGGSKYAKRVQRDQVYPALQFFAKPSPTLQ